ncbi:MAG: cyclic pyranopterin monophosphate synthase MoaC [Alphaproteobacteria bacterium]|nr:cyclic pyranopterin monophosphate synthase MoaC [Alphaproteobacteria bacterium]TAD92317.1 MAG: cyclic pyranopterin monophosphate synthase MoaC [Alphaproteobacteria bacterium]
MSDLTHFDADGRAVMVDVGDKPQTRRTATAAATILMHPETLARIQAGTVGKGDVLGIARIAGIQAAKRTGDLIPLCHPLGLERVTVDFTIDADASAIHVSATCALTGKTGVEMEAMTAASVASLTIYDMVKAVDRGMRITDLRLTHKSGGKSGTFEQP